MPETVQLTLTIAKEVADTIREAVASGAYPDEGAFVAEKMQESFAMDLSNDVLTREVLPVYDAMQVDPYRGIPLDEARARMAEHHKNRSQVTA